MGNRAIEIFYCKLNEVPDPLLEDCAVKLQRVFANPKWAKGAFVRFKMANCFHQACDRLVGEEYTCRVIYSGFAWEDAGTVSNTPPDAYAMTGFPKL